MAARRVQGLPWRAAHHRRSYPPGVFSQGERAFDYHFMGEQVYEQTFTVVPCDPSEVPPAYEIGQPLGRHLDGCRIGFDLGASDRKVSAVVDGQVVYSEEVVWEPRKQADPGYHYREILSALKTAASKMPRVDAVGGSSAGYSSTTVPWWLRCSVASQGTLPRNSQLVPADSPGAGRALEVINDGDVTALAGSMSLEDTGVLGIAMGSSEAAGYVDLQGHILGWLSELAFAPSITARRRRWMNGQAMRGWALNISPSSAFSAWRRAPAFKSRPA